MFQYVFICSECGTAFCPILHFINIILYSKLYIWQLERSFHPSAIKGKIHILKHLHNVSHSFLFVVIKKLSHKTSEGGWNTHISVFSSLLLSIRLLLSPANFRHSNAVSNGKTYMSVPIKKSFWSDRNHKSTSYGVRSFKGEKKEKGDKEGKENGVTNQAILLWLCRRQWVLINPRVWADANSSCTNSQMKM